MTSTVPVAGWYTDPQDVKKQRFWSGADWTRHVQPRPSTGISARQDIPARNDLRPDQAVLPAAAFMNGALDTLGMCAKHGQPATGSKRKLLHTSIPLLFLALGFAAILLFRRYATGPIPTCEACTSGRLASLAKSAGGLIFSLVTILTGIVLMDSAYEIGVVLALLGLVLLGVSSVLSIRHSRVNVTGQVSGNGAQVLLNHVHPSFAQAVHSHVDAALRS